MPQERAQQVDVVEIKGQLDTAAPRDAVRLAEETTAALAAAAPNQGSASGPR
ncbi:MAG: hypothetical protein WBP72_19360 [Rhodocyclaceae bacterium]